MNRGMLLIQGVRLGARLLDLLERTTRRRIRRASALAFLGGAGLGAALMYLLDPDRGRRRRKLLGDQVVHLVSQSDTLINTTARDLRNRARGMLAETRARFEDTDVIDAVLAARVRSRMGWVISHPHAIAVSADHGRVTLSGPILAHEVDDLLKAVAAVRGVRAVEHRLEVHERADDVPGLQGGGARPGKHPEVLQENWAPAPRLLISATGGGLAVYGVRRGDALGGLLAVLGLGLLARGATNIEAKRLLGLGAGRRAVDVQKTITISAPVEEVFRFWSNVANFPHFMAHLREVRELGNGRSHWVAEGPAGVRVSWNAVITRAEPNKVLAWQSEPGATVANAGTIRFESVAGGTRVDIKLSYNPPAGALGHVVAKLLGADPKSELDDDLVRLKSLIEHGKASVGGTTVTREDVDPGHGAEPAPDLEARERGAEPPMPGD
jgi:uncharacterized membrane protein